MELSTTQIYTQVSIRRLKTVHALTHPGAKIDRPTGTAVTTDAANEEGAGPIPPLAADEPRGRDAAELMATLAAETEED